MAHVKRKHTTLTLVQRSEILKRLDNGESIRSLANEFGVGRSTIHGIQMNAPRIKAFFQINQDENTERKTLRAGQVPQVDFTLYNWILQEQKNGTLITNKILQEKARAFFQSSNLSGVFQASEGWLEKFKKRFGIRMSAASGGVVLSEKAKPMSTGSQAELDRAKAEYEKWVGSIESAPSAEILPKAVRPRETHSFLEPAVSIEELDASHHSKEDSNSSTQDYNDSSNWDERSIESLEVKEEPSEVPSNGRVKRPPPLQYMDNHPNKYQRRDESSSFSPNITTDPQETSDSGVSRASTKNEDLYDAFGKYVASLLRELGNPESLQAQQEITAFILAKMGKKSSIAIKKELLKD